MAIGNRRWLAVCEFATVRRLRHDLVKHGWDLRNPMSAEAQFERALSEFLDDESTVRAMVAASEAGRPAVEAIGSDLLRQFGDRVRPNSVKQHIGRLIRPIMESQGFERDKPRHAESPLFTDGMVYRRQVEPIFFVLEKHGFQASADAVRREVWEATQNVLGDPPFVERPRVDWPRFLLESAPALYDQLEVRLAFSSALDHELRQQARRRQDVVLNQQLTAEQRRRLGLAHHQVERQDGCLPSRVRSALTFGALCATGFTLPETARLLDFDERVVSNLIKERHLYVPPSVPKVSRRIPLFQFQSDGLVPKVEKVLPRLDATIHPIGVFNWFTSPNPDLAVQQSDFEPTSPRNWLLHHHSLEPVCRLAASVAVASPS